MKDQETNRIVILGAGPAGLGAAFYLENAGFTDWVLHEREACVGGLSRSIRDDKGFTWDIGGHVVFSHYDVYTRLLDALLGKDHWIEHQRESWIRLLNTWVPYPFQNNIHRLPPPQRAQCIEGLVQAALRASSEPFVHFEDFIVRTFGRGIADVFMIPYNRKVWAYSPSQLDSGWIGERVAVPDAARAARNLACGVDDSSWGPNSTFRFPRYGGTGAIYEALAATLPREKIFLGSAATAIDVAAKKVLFGDNRAEEYDTLISTIPLDQLARMSGRQDWEQAACRLTHSSMHVIGIGLHGQAPPELRTKCWIYSPEQTTPFYRVTHFSLYSPNNVDDISKHWSLMAEVSESPHKPVDAGSVIEETIRGLAATGLIRSPSEVFNTWHMRVEYGYPTPTPQRDKALAYLLPALEDQGILSRGRFGAWRYEVGNQDHSFMQGFEAAAHRLFGRAGTDALGRGVGEHPSSHPRLESLGVAPLSAVGRCEIVPASSFAPFAGVAGRMIFANPSLSIEDRRGMSPSV